MNIKPVIKWSGSKRSQATEIMKYIPEQYETYYEPFVGGGSILYALSPQKAVCRDICEPLIELWNAGNVSVIRSKVSSQFSSYNR